MSPNQNPKVIFETSLGSFTLELDSAKAPITVANFLSYVQDGFYDGLIFHRVIPTFMVQGGGMDPEMNQKKTKTPIKNEADNGLRNDRGTIAMARTGVVDSATAQFFINVKDNEFLNHKGKSPSAYGYAVFGKVIDGMTTIDKIKDVRTGFKAGHDDVPVEPVVIRSAKLL